MLRLTASLSVLKIFLLVLIESSLSLLLRVDPTVISALPFVSKLHKLEKVYMETW